MIKTKKNNLFKIMCVMLLIFGFAFMFSGCNQAETHIKGTITEKYTEEIYNKGASWFWDKPIYDTHYYFLIKTEENKNIEIEIEREEYYKYDIDSEYIK